MTKPFKITFCGDTSLGYYYLEKSKNKYPEAYERLQNDPFSFFEGVAPLLEGSDEVIINLETVLTHNPGEPIEGKEYPGFDNPDVTVEVLKKLGTTAVTLANNHAMDFGEDKLIEMIDLLHANGIATIGAGRNINEARKPYVITLPDSGKKVYILNGMRARKRYIEYGFFAEKDKPGIANTNIEAMKRAINKIRSQDETAKIIVVPHWQGVDYKNVNENHVKWCRDLIELGADAIVGHGTHKRGELIEAKDKPIYLSIGNFVFNSPGRYSALEAEPSSMVVSFEFSNDEVSHNHDLIFSDNKQSDFNVHLIKSYASNTGLNSKPGMDLNISGLMQKLLPKDGYEIKGNKEASFSGFDIALARYRKNVFYIIADQSCPKKILNRQKSIGIEKLIKKAISKGFDRFVAPREYSDAFKNFQEVESLVTVDNTWPFFLDASNYIRKNSGCKVFAVTGSAGKTSTCEMLKTVLRQWHGDDLYVAEGVNRNLFRDSISTLSRLNGYKAAVLEVSASNQFKKNKFFISPDVAIFTALSEAHTEYLGSLNDIAKTKSTLFQNMPTNGRIVLNLDMPCSDIVHKIAQSSANEVITYGESVAANVRLLHHDLDKGIAEVSYFGEKVYFKTNLLAKHMLINAISVITALSEKGADWEAIAKELESFIPSKGRGAMHEIAFKEKKLTLVDESYNSNIASVKASLDSLSNYFPKNNGRRVAVIGDMLELGDMSQQLHKKLGSLINKSIVDKVILVGEEVIEAWRELPSAKKIALLPDCQNLLQVLDENTLDGDVVLFKASNGIGLGKVIDNMV